MKNSKQLLSQVMRSELCNRCGTCVGLSEGKIRFGNREGRFLPEVTGKLEDQAYDRIWNACPGRYFDFPANREHFFKNAPHFHTYTGPYRQLYIGHATDAALRLAGA
ncbi:MAG: hypothetical protein ABFS10_15525, partial [Bacteroidota bacterium]